MGGGDGLCSNVGAGSISPGRTFSCIGTSAWVATTSEKPLFDAEMRTFTWGPHRPRAVLTHRHHAGRRQFLQLAQGPGGQI